MSSTRFWGEPDNKDIKSDVLRGDPSIETVKIVWGEIGGNGWPEGSKFRGTLPSSVYKPSNGVNGNEYHTVLG